MNKNEPIRILLADDDLEDHTIFQEAFEGIKMNTVVETVKDGVELMRHFEKSEVALPHILFLDLNMPKKSGIECLDEIKKMSSLKDVAIVIYSTSGSERDIEESFVRGANVYMQKPSDFARLKKLLAEVITINWQYQTSGLNRDNFLLSL